jgi:hypothetical protein
MSSTTRLLVLALFALRLFQLHPLFAQNPMPIQADLVQRLNAGKVKVGDSILAKLLLPWKSPACDLSAGAIIQGHVVAQKAHSKSEKTSEIGITFESGQCGGREMKPLALTVAAVLAPLHSSDSDSFDSEELQPLNSAIGLGLNGTLRSAKQASEIVKVEPRQPRAPRAVMTGQVVGIPNLAISVGQGPDGASMLRSTGRDVQLSPGTQFVLVLNVRSGPNISADAKIANPKTVTKSSVAPIIDFPPSTIADENELCVAPDCTIALAAGQFDHATQGKHISLPLKGLGYLPAPVAHEMSNFDYDASIAYLGPDQFLFTFNLHTLVHRSAAEAISSRGLRIVRAVLIDLQDKKVARTVDWRVPDSGRYLWPIGENRVLVHVGQELRVYGPGLRMFDKISLEGPLAFVQISPASEFVAVGVIHERHTREIHRQLEEAEAREPEEDVEIRLLDSRFRSLTTIMRTSRLPPPVLLDEGEVQIHSVARNRWEFVEKTWTGEQRVLAVASSTCMPHANSVAGNLLFVLGCGKGARWYRILHSDGKVVLNGWSISSELGQTAGGNVGRNVFAIRIAEATTSRSSLSVFKPSELKSSHVAVYRATNGHRIFSMGVPDLAPAVQTFAISPREDQVAFLKAGEIAFYQVSVE